MKNILTKSVLGVAILTALAYGCKKNSIWDTFIPETDEDPTAAQISGYVFRPALVPASSENVSQLKVPSGFKVSKFAEHLGKPRILVTSASGNLYASDREAGVVMMLKDNNGDGKADVQQIVATLKQAHGLAIHNNMMYIAAVRELYSAPINPDGSLGEPVMLTDDLPDGGQHPNRTLAFGPDGMLYISVGSTCNSCPEPNKRNATMLRANPDGTNITVYAKGLRNTIGFDWHPATKEMWGMDHGIDWLGDDDQKEELNLISENAGYGWPYIFGEGKYNPASRPESDTTYQQYLKMSTLPVLTYQAHAAPMQMVFYKGDQFPAEYKNDAFIAMRGSWNRSKPVGYKVLRIHFENGKPVRFEDFLTGFLVDNNRAHFGRLVGVAVHTDGSLFVSDDTNGVIYRVTRS